MPLIQLVLTAASLAAAAGGTWGLDRVIERHARIPEQTNAASEGAAAEDDDKEHRLLY